MYQHWNIAGRKQCTYCAAVVDGLKEVWEKLLLGVRLLDNVRRHGQRMQRQLLRTVRVWVAASEQLKDVLIIR